MTKKAQMEKLSILLMKLLKLFRIKKITPLRDTLKIARTDLATATLLISSKEDYWLSKIKSNGKRGRSHVLTKIERLSMNYLKMNMKKNNLYPQIHLHNQVTI